MIPKSAAFKFEVKSQKSLQTSAWDSVRSNRKDGVWGRVRGWLLSQQFQIAVQATFAVFLTSLFVFVRCVSFPSSSVLKLSRSGLIVYIYMYGLNLKHPAWIKEVIFDVTYRMASA